MGEVCSILETVDGWINRLRSFGGNKKIEAPETKIITIETNDNTTTPDHEIWRQNFLVDSPALRRLLLNVSTESNIFEIICTINRLIFFYVIVKWVNYERDSFFITLLQTLGHNFSTSLLSKFRTLDKYITNIFNKQKNVCPVAGDTRVEGDST
ncbi:hypothetical protein WN51_09278 [Melipona quadrifasciata]|uniref:Uncharacterized protein n=1 Tax=Melipona quadrifasciata TaxID=166423 RepID=A0A0M9A7P4_9HYME|nr:hypothetical protein WN51_09278 [Melipona quadrifasciata]